LVGGIPGRGLPCIDGADGGMRENRLFFGVELGQGSAVSSENEKDFEPGRRNWRSFWALVGMQGTNAFNDNFTKFILIPLGVGLASLGLAPEGMKYVLGLLMVLPFIIFAPTAGWLGDRYPKNLVIRWSSWFQLVVLLLMGGALWIGATYGKEHSGVALVIVMGAFFLLAIQSALLSPSKMGVVKELVGAKRLGFANRVMEGSMILMILLGQIIGGVWFDKWGLQAGRGIWESAMIPVFWVLIGAVVALVLSHMIQPTKAAGAGPYSAEVAMRHFGDLKKVKQDRPLWQSTLGIAFFWGFGGFLQLLLVQIAQERKGDLAGMGVETALLWVPVVVGIVIGSLVASWICGRRNELGLVVIGGMMMTVATGLLAVIPSGLSADFLLGLAGCGGALFLVPLNAFQQDRAPENERGLVISASNLCNNLAGVFAVLLQAVLEFSGVPTWVQFVLVAVICGVVTVFIMRLLPKDFIRLVVLGVFRSVYKIRAIGVEHVPKEGGVLMVPNHLTYIDAFILSAACPRPIRFVLFADCFENKWVGKFARLFDAVAISPSKARDGIRVTAEALKEGTVVCVFAEGQLSRTGALSEIKRGYQMMAKKGESEVLPAYMDGLWGSMWSFSEGNFLKKWPKKIRYGVSVAFGPTIPWNGNVGAELRELSVETVADREEKFMARLRREPKLVGGLPQGWDEMKKKSWADDEVGRGMRRNALQLNQVHLANRRTRLLVEWVPGDEVSGILGILWPLSLGAKVGLADGLSDEEILAKVEGDGIGAVALRGIGGRETLVGKLVEREVLVWSFDEEGVSDGKSFGCLVRAGRVVSFALPDPDYETTTELPQSGWRKGTRGKLLPGWAEAKVRPLDEEGFLLFKEGE
jgi:acyl-[acyl-carrier-protein]-phospholipid O-acyltransferase/long-chain-fatty-acid--[acyl-carrier-protein] ligase